jgi:hypothetical protein
MTEPKKPRKTPVTKVDLDAAKKERKAKFNEWHKQQQEAAAARRLNANG